VARVPDTHDARTSEGPIHGEAAAGAAASVGSFSDYAIKAIRTMIRMSVPSPIPMYMTPAPF
jgi:hypothetical protein